MYVIIYMCVYTYTLSFFCLKNIKLATNLKETGSEFFELGLYVLPDPRESSHFLVLQFQFLMSSFKFFLQFRHCVLFYFGHCSSPLQRGR